MAGIRNSNEDVVKSGALRLTWVSGAIGGIAAIVTVFNEEFVHLFGEHASDGIKASILIAIIAAWAIIAVADLLGRSITTSARLRLKANELLSAPKDELITAPKGMRVKLTDGVDSEHWTVAAIRTSNGGGTAGLEFLVAKAGQEPQWVKQKGLVFES